MHPVLGTVGPAFCKVSAALGMPPVPAASAHYVWNSRRKRRRRPRSHRRPKENMCLADHPRCVLAQGERNTIKKLYNVFHVGKSAMPWNWCLNGF